MLCVIRNQHAIIQLTLHHSVVQACNLDLVVCSCFLSVSGFKPQFCCKSVLRIIHSTTQPISRVHGCSKHEIISKLHKVTKVHLLCGINLRTFILIRISLNVLLQSTDLRKLAAVFMAIVFYPVNCQPTMTVV